MPNEITLKPCPFCENDDKEAVTMGLRFLLPDQVHVVTCEACGTTGPMCDDRDDAIKAWNTRLSAQPAPVGEVAKPIDLDLIAKIEANPKTHLAPHIAKQAVEEVKALRQALTAMQAERDEARGALRFYADPISYVATQESEPRSAIHFDAGKRAKAALAEGGGS